MFSEIAFIVALMWASNFDEDQDSIDRRSESQAQLIVAPRMNRPTSAVIGARYDCGGDDVRLELKLSGTAVQVHSYSDANGPASDDELALWNGWLADVDPYHTFGVACQGGGAVIVYVYEPNPRLLRDPPYVAVFWDGGEIKRLPYTPGPSHR